MINKLNILNTVNQLNGDCGGAGYSPMSRAYFDAMDVQLPSATKKVIDAAIVATEDIIAKMDCFMLTLATEQQSLLYLNDPTKTGVKVNSPTFTPYKGWSGDATNYIDTGFNPGDGGTYNFKQDDALILAFKNNLSNQPSRSILGIKGVNYYTGISLAIYSDQYRILGELNATDYSSLANYNPIKVKEFLFNRRISSTEIRRNFNKDKKTHSTNSTAVVNSTIKYAFTDDKCPLIIVGGYLTDQEMSDFQDAWLPVLEHLGSDYWSNFTPTTLTATAGAGKIDLAWTLPVTTYSPYTVTNVVIQESTDNVTFTDIATLGAVEAYEATVPTGQTRYYKIRYISSRNIHTTNSAEAHATAL